MWQQGILMPEQAVSYICGRIRLWLAVKVISLAVLCGLWIILILWRDLKRIGRIKRRDFSWCSGVTAGFIGKRWKGTVQVGSGTVSGYGFPAGMFYLRNGMPVYVITLNIRDSSLLKGGFITDPLVFKNKI